jgi:hypothetical protein
MMSDPIAQSSNLLQIVIDFLSELGRVAHPAFLKT